MPIVKMKMCVMENVLRKTFEETYPRKIFASQLITLDDLQKFQNEFFEKLDVALRSLNHLTPKKWMKAHEVRRMLKISPGTLQTLKATGVIPYTKIGGVHFFDYDDIQKILQQGKIPKM
jgi:hypothetical protein